MNKTLKVAKYILIIFMAWFIAHSIYITIDGLHDKGTKADVAIILGNKVNEDGTVSNRLKARLDEGLQLYNQHRVQKIIVSGGLGKEGFWEGSKMQEHLVANKIPAANIIGGMAARREWKYRNVYAAAGFGRFVEYSS